MEQELTEKEKEFITIMDEAKTLQTYIPNWVTPKGEYLYKICYLLVRKSLPPKHASSTHRKSMILELMKKYVNDVSAKLEGKNNVRD
jgi:hypothetical protein